MCIRDRVSTQSTWDINYMKSLLFVLSLAVVAFSLEAVYKAHFVIEFKELKYSFDGYGYCDVDLLGARFVVSKDIVATINGTMKDETSATHVFVGNVKIQEPPLTHLNKIRLEGYFTDKPENVTFEGIIQVNAWDVMKKKVPFKGKATFSNGKEGALTGIIDNPFKKRMNYQPTPESFTLF
eukprot:TRINITY_DN6122_c0_g1_i2.p2 TRINITY_DN6122_c0_g1~~TRINITY_DN6122_c0_g1_i2.p2  ORF type:complete len:181 (+),score=57.13 TRINITY_DN6122_c0_g1_i2:67-609(+)